MSFKSFVGKSKYLLTGLIIGSVLTTGVAYAAGSDYVLSLFQAKLVFNGVEKQGSDKPYMYHNGQDYVPTSLIYNGTTYVPLRFFSEAVGLPVDYDGSTETISVGKTPGGSKIATYMSDILKPYYTSGGSISSNPNMTIAGDSYRKGYMIDDTSEFTASFNLAGKYENIDGLVGLIDGNNKSDATLYFYGDDKLLSTVEIPKGSLPQNLNVGVKGVIKLDIKYKSNYFNKLGIANLMIK